MGTRDAVRMTEAEVADFLAANRKVQVATVGPDGAPHLTTLFYVLDEGRIAFWTYGSSQKVRNLERDPRISCLVESGEAYDELAGVSVTGTAELVRDTDAVERLGMAVVVRMTGVSSADELGDVGRDGVARQARKRVAVLVTPDKVASWDHAKMAGERQAQT
jgi:PPOX class probable F420-dependent enzyme